MQSLDDSGSMQIFVKTLNGRTLTIDVRSSDSIGAVQERVASKWDVLQGKGWPENLVLKKEMTVLSSERTVGSYGIRRETQLVIAMKSQGAWKRPDDSLLSELALLLKELMHKEKILVFIGVGSSCASGKRMEEQQFPKWLEKIRGDRHIHVILVDAGYASSEYGEIYHNGDFREEKHDMIKLYKNTRETATVHVLCTNVNSGEYDGSGQDKPTTLAGVKYVDIGSAIESRGGLLIAGNFYSEGAEPYYISPSLDWMHLQNL